MAIVSDTHFGDQMCTLVDHDKPFEGDGSPRPGVKHDAFVEKAGTDNDYLILLGDIFDFSIVGYARAYEMAKAFFLLIKRDNIARSIIYVPGNHDFEMWHTVEHQIRVIRQVRRGKPAKRFRWSAPGLIDDRKDRKRGFRLPDIIDEVVLPERMVQEEKMYLNTITKNEDGSGEETNFYFAYPNLYMVTDRESILMTHGHYLEAYWTLLGEWAMKIGQEDLKIGDALDVRELVAINFPSCQLACSGVGQAGPLTKVVQQVQREVKDQVLERVEKYLNCLDDELDRLTPYGYFDPREWGTDLVSNVAKKKVLEALRKFRETRYSEEFINKKEVLDRFRSFYGASWVEICQLNQDHGFDIPMPQRVIFGHTHQPIRWGSEDAIRAKVIGGCPVWLYNTGGWLWRKTKDGQKVFCGAEVFTYDSAQGFNSQTVT